MSTPASGKTQTASFEQLQPAGLPENMSPEKKEQTSLQYQIRMLNVSFQRKIAEMDPSNNDFEKVIAYYLRVRAFLGAPVGEDKPKRKIEEEQNVAAEGPSSKKAKTVFGADVETPTKATPSTPTATAPASASAVNNSNKRKSPEPEGDDGRPEKKVNGASTTANIFAQSFSKSKSSETDDDSAQTGPATPGTGSPVKAPSLFPTPSASSPAKPNDASPANNTGNSAPSLFGSSASVSKPTFAAPTANASAAPNPFVLKPSGDKNADATSGPPKFNAAPTNFFAQFKAQADKSAEKEKAKRKAEDFDSDEDDEAEWERKDAEKQRQKRQQFESATSKRSVYVPGKGFVFEEVSASTSADKAAESAAPASGAGASVFDTKAKSPANSNIFGHLSATPSEVEENDADDTEEASAAGDDQDEGSKDPSFAQSSEKAITPAVSANDSSDDGDFAKALQKTKPAEKPETNGPTESNSGSRSLFDRVQYDDEGNPKRQGEEEKLSTFFNSSKYASSFNSPAPSTPNPFGQSAKAQPDQAESPFSKPATPNPFGNLFGSSTNSSAPTPSIFGANNNNGTPKPASDQTWKINSPIKFASDSTASTGPKIDFTSSTSTSSQSKPLSNLFGGTSGTSNSSIAGTSSTTGFSFGDPSQKPASFLAPSNISSAVPSRTPTPGVTTDTGAEESGDGEAAESLPQVDLSRGGAGEENEDVVLELRARGMKLAPESAGWESQGVGYVRILKDRNTSRGRILLRADPSGKVVLNATLMNQIKYNVSGNSVQFLVPQATGPPEQWAVRVKKEEVQRLGSAIDETKS